MTKDEIIKAVRKMVNGGRVYVESYLGAEYERDYLEYDEEKDKVYRVFGFEGSREALTTSQVVSILKDRCKYSPGPGPCSKCDLAYHGQCVY